MEKEYIAFDLREASHRKEFAKLIRKLNNDGKPFTIHPEMDDCVAVVETSKDASLIAAAPELLEAIKSCLPIIDEYRRISGGDGDLSAMNARRAIDKAEGRDVNE